MSDRNIIIMRHFETIKDTSGNEKILYDKSLEKSKQFTEFIRKYLENKPEINKIVFYVSKHERTLISALILSNQIKSKIILNKLRPIQINDPVINDIIDRDPKKKKNKKTCEKIKNDLDPVLKSDTLYIFVSHSSVILNLFECFCKSYSGKYNDKLENKIHSYSLSLINKSDKRLIYDFNINMR